MSELLDYYAHQQDYWREVKEQRSGYPYEQAERLERHYMRLLGFYALRESPDA